MKPSFFYPGPKDQPRNKWWNPAQQRRYTCRLIDALRATASGGPRAVKTAAESALALTDRGRSRWSRAILLGRCPRKLLRRKACGKIRSDGRRSRPETVVAGWMKVGDRLRLLRRLVPGCWKLSAPSVLAEAADYVAALEMQVKAMRALAEALSAARAVVAAGQEREGGLSIRCSSERLIDGCCL